VRHQMVLLPQFMTSKGTNLSQYSTLNATQHAGGLHGLDAR